MNGLVIIQVERTVDLQRVVQELRLVANLVGGQLLWIVIRRITEEHEVVAAGAVTGGGREVHHNFVVDVPVQVDAARDLFVFTIERTIDRYRNRVSAVYNSIGWNGLAVLVCNNFTVSVHFEAAVGFVDFIEWVAGKAKRWQETKQCIAFRITEQVLFSDNLVVRITNSHGQR